MYTISKGPSQIVAKTRRGERFSFPDAKISQSDLYLEPFIFHPTFQKKKKKDRERKKNVNDILLKFYCATWSLNSIICAS